MQAAPYSGGVKVARIVAGGTAEAMGLKADDILISLNGQKIDDPTEFVSVVRTLDAGAKVNVRFKRADKESSSTGTMAERPKVTEPELDVIYDQVVSQGKRIRVILTKPKGDGKFPALFLIGGIGTYSVDAPFASMPYGNVIGPIAHAGFATIRIDKPGMGDSEGPAYKDLKFSVEQDAYLQALRLAKTLPFIDSKRIAIFGHSMGGCFGPLVAAEEPVKALIVNGTLIKSFTEYMLENTRRQSELAGADENELDQAQKQLSTTLHFLFGESMTPAQIATKRPELAQFVKETFPDGETYSGVGIPFFRELANTNLAKGWRDSRCDVLSIYSENDFLSGRDDHERIAAYVNKLRPGTAEFKLLAGIDHGFTKTTSMLDSQTRWGKGGEFNPIIVDTLLDYLKKELK